jgi:broad specificity phosphatase PhoE
MFKEELIIIRHARSEYNLRTTEDLDSSLTEFGQLQARKVGEFLRDHVDLRGMFAYTSPFLRCLQTMHGILKPLEELDKYEFERRGLAGLFSCRIMPELREYVNHSNKEVAVVNRSEEYSAHVHTTSHKPFFGGYEWSCFPEAGQTFKPEQNEEFLVRMHRAYELLPGKSVVVTHGLPAQLLIAIARNPTTNEVPIWDYSIGNASITYIKRGRTIWYSRDLYFETDNDPYRFDTNYEKQAVNG